MRLLKCLAVLLSVAILCTLICIPVSASNDDVAPAYEMATFVDNDLSISSGTATCTSICSGNSSVTKTTVVQTLEKHSGWFWIWNSVDGASWTTTNYYNGANVSNSKAGLTSGTYRLKSDFTFTDSSGKTETITVYSDEVTIS